MTKNNNKLLIINQYFPPDFAATGQLIDSISKFISSKNIDVEILTTMPNYSNLKSKPPKNEKWETIQRRELRNDIIFTIVAIPVIYVFVVCMCVLGV